MRVSDEDVKFLETEAPQWKAHCFGVKEHMKFFDKTLELIADLRDLRARAKAVVTVYDQYFKNPENKCLWLEIGPAIDALREPEAKPQEQIIVQRDANGRTVYTPETEEP